MAHLKAIEGDKSDNIPGVDGVGAKSAQTLLQKFGTVDGILENLESVADMEGLRGAKRVQERLTAGAEQRPQSL